MANVTARWPLAVVVSVAVHGAIAFGLFALLGHAVAPAAKPVIEKPSVVEVFRIGSLMPRAGKTSSSAGPAAPAPATPRHSPTPRADQPVPSGDQPRPDDSVVSDAVDAPPASDGPSNGALAGPGAGEAPAATEPGNANAGSGSTSTTDQVDPSIAAEVHARLARAANDCYPAQARRFRQQGQVPVSFCVEGSGAASKVVVTSSGAALLDEAARGCVMQRAEPFPAAAAGSCFVVKVEFGSAGVHVSR